MDIRVVQHIPYPRAVAFEALRDRLEALADYLPNVDRIEVQEREEPEPGTVSLLNKWTAARTEVPAVARPFVPKSKLNWLDRAIWRQGSWTCDWDMKMAFMTERISCRGTNTYVEVDAEHTEIRIQGTLEIELKGMMPKIVARRAGPKVERFVIDLIKPNFERIAEGLTRYLDAQRESTP